MATFPLLYAKTAGGAVNYWQIWTEGPKVCVRWGQVGGAEQTDSYYAKGKNVGRSNETSPEQQAVLEAESKHKKQLRLKYVTSIEEAQTGLNIKPMLAHVLDDKRKKKLAWPVTVQPKFNGVRCLAYNNEDGSVRLMSRGGKDYTLPHIQRQLVGRLPNGWALDGELYIHRTSLQTIRHHIETLSESTLQVSYHCYDCTRVPPDGTAWDTRHAHLTGWYAQHFRECPNILLSPAIAVDSLEGIEKAHEFWTGDGFEGVIVRLHEGPYRLGHRSTHLLKYKKFQDAEFPVVGWGIGKDGVVIYTCEQEDGRQFDVRPVGTEAERAQLLAEADKAVGRLLTVRFQERSNDNIPIFPVGVGFRPAADMD